MTYIFDRMEYKIKQNLKQALPITIMIQREHTCLVRALSLPFRCVNDETLTTRDGTGLLMSNGSRTLVRQKAPI